VVCIRVVNEQLLFRIPAELALELESAPCELADSIRSHRDVDIRDRLLPGADTLNEVSLVEVADRQANVVGAERIIQERSRLGFDGATVDPPNRPYPRR